MLLNVRLISIYEQSNAKMTPSAASRSTSSLTATYHMIRNAVVDSWFLNLRQGMEIAARMRLRKA